MKSDTKRSKLLRGLAKGYSVLELVLSLLAILIIAAVAVPKIIQTLKIYQLNARASQVAGILKLTRFEAIRRNSRVSCAITQTPSGWLLWADSNGNGTADSTEKQVLITGSETLLPSSFVPGTSALTTVLGVSNLVVLSGSNGALAFDARGVVYFGAAPPTVYALFLGNGSNPDFGYRAVILLPSGVVQIWASQASGNWQQMS